MSDTETLTPVSTWPDCDAALGRLRVARAELEAQSAEFDIRIQAIEEEKAAACRGLKDECDRTEAAILAFVDLHRGELKPPRRSTNLVHGTVGIRAGTPKVVFSQGESHAIDTQRARGQLQCFVERVELVKTEVKKLPAHELRYAGIELVQDEKPFLKLADNPVVDYPKSAEGGGA